MIYFWVVLVFDVRVENRATDNLQSVTLVLQQQGSAVALKSVPDPSVVVLILRHGVGQSKGAGFKLLTGIIVGGTSHVSSVALEVFADTNISIVVVRHCKLLRLNVSISEKARCSFSISSDNSLIQKLVDSQWGFVELHKNLFTVE